MPSVEAHPPHRILVFLRREPIQVGLLILFTTGILILNMGNQGSGDEGGQIGIARQSPAYIATHFCYGQNHPLYGLLAHQTIRNLPFSIRTSARIPSFIAGLFIPWVFYRGGKRWVGHEAAILAAFLFVFVDPISHYGAAARGYAFLIMGTMVLNGLLLGFLESGRVTLAVGYVAVAAPTCYSHLWSFAVLSAHGAFAIVEAARRDDDRLVAGRLVGALAFLAASVAVGLLLYAPMIPEIRAMGGQRGSGLKIEAVTRAVLELVRYGSWSVAAGLVMVPVLLEGLARREDDPLLDRGVRLHLTIIAWILAFAAVLSPVVFGSRFLLGIAPSLFALASWALAGYWRGAGDCDRCPVLPRFATCLIGFGLGVLVANERLSHEIPPGSNADVGGDYQGNVYRVLAGEVGNPAARLMIGLGLAWAVVRWKFPRPSGWQAIGMTRAAIAAWTLVLLASFYPLVIGPYLMKPRGVYEVHMVAVGAIALLAWWHRFDASSLRRLRYGLLASAVIVALWQAGVPEFAFDPAWLARLPLIFPPLLVVGSLARTTRCPG